MSTAFDLDAYFARIAYDGESAPTLGTLRALHLCHAKAIAFENLNPLLGWPVRLDAGSLQQKLVRSGRGGYCFEHNLVFRHALEALGFKVTGLAARVRWNVPESVVTSRGHMLLRVDISGRPYLADVGFGGLTLTGPLRFELGAEQATPHERFRLIGAGDGFLMQAEIGGAWKTLYLFDLVEQFLVDYEVTSWYLSNHPDSPFVTGLVAARPDADRRYTLRNHEFAVHYLDGRTERRVLGDAHELRKTLESVFRLSLPDVPEVDAALTRVTAAAPSP